MDVQCQTGGNDCALFAVVNGATICLGGEPHITGCMQDGLSHLAQCFMTADIACPRTPKRARETASSPFLNWMCFVSVAFNGIKNTAGEDCAMPDLKRMVPPYVHGH